MDTLKMTGTKIDRYAYRNGFYVDIVTTEDMFEAWMGHVECGISSLMFGIPKKQINEINGDINYEDMLEMVEANMDDHIEFFMEDYMNG